MVQRNYCDIGEQKGRIKTILAFLTIFAVIILGRLFYLQAIKHDYYLKLAASQHWSKDTIPASRGKILVKDTIAGGYYPLADNRQLELVYASPVEIENKGEAASKLAGIIGEEEAKIKGLIENSHTYVVLKHRLEFEQTEKVRALNIKGIYTVEEETRFYPEANLAAQLLGYVDTEGDGKYGLEQYFNDELAGVPGLYKAETDPSGKIISFGQNIQVAPKNGTDLVLTINRDIQLQAEKIVKATAEKFSAENASIIVMNPDNGEILAMTNYPNFDPNKYQDVTDYNLFQNSTVSDSFEPGSIFKVITMAAGLDSGKVQPDTEYEDTGSLTLNGHKIMNSDKKANGWQTMTQVLEKSLNTGTVYILNQIGKSAFFEYLQKFGFGIATGIEQPNEASGQIYAPDSEGINDHTYATMTFGQSISVTPVQIIASFAAIANGGDLVKPHLVTEKHHSDGKKEFLNHSVTKDVISDEAAAKEREMMVSVVEHGHGGQAKVKGYKVAGKTGTAQVAKKDGSGYETNKNIGSFIGFAPADDAKFVVLAKVDSPKGVPWAESTAAPMVGQMLDFLFKYYQVAPTEPI